MSEEHPLLNTLKDSNPSGYRHYKKLCRKSFKKNLNNLIIFIAEVYQKYIKKEELERLQHVKTLRPTSYKRLMKQGFYKTVNCASLSAYKNIKSLNKFKAKNFASRVYGVNKTYTSPLDGKSLENILD